VSGVATSRVLTAEPVVGMAVGPLTMNLSLQRLIMVSGANRDFAMTHIDPVSAREGGAPSAYADIMFIFTMAERLLIEWAGPRAVLRRLGPIRLKDFVVCGEQLNVVGVITAVNPERSTDGEDGLLLAVGIEFVQDNRKPVTGTGQLWIPRPAGRQHGAWPEGDPPEERDPA
jgi:hypothetical protein